MPALNTQSDYGLALAALRPTGLVWPTDPDSQQVETLTAAAGSFERLDAAAQALLVDAFPATTVNLLPEWQKTLGISPNDSLSGSQDDTAVLAKLIAVGGASGAYFIAYAASLGVSITITTYAAAKAGRTTCGQPCNGYRWPFAWSIHVTANTGALSSAELLAAIAAIAPAETLVFLD